MHVELNLATYPKENRRRFYVLATATLAVLLVVGGAQGATLFRNWWGGRGVARQEERLRTETGRLESEEKKFRQDLTQPEAKEVLDRSHFLNVLILQKSVSWTQIFMDLEKLVPDRVQVLSIRPEIVAGNELRLEMVVGGESHGQLIELLRRIEKSDKFGTPVVKTESPPAPGDREATHRLSLMVAYVQK